MDHGGAVGGVGSGASGSGGHQQGGGNQNHEYGSRFEPLRPATSVWNRRAETLIQANARVVAAQARILLAQEWGGGEGASAGGRRFVVPVRTINAGPNRGCFYNWLVIGHIVESNPAASVRVPKLVVRDGKTPVLQEAELRQLFDSLPAISVRDFRDSVLLGVFVYYINDGSVFTPTKNPR